MDNHSYEPKTFLERLGLFLTVLVVSICMVFGIAVFGLVAVLFFIAAIIYWLITGKDLTD